MKTAGDILKNKRQYLGLSIDKVATKLKIHKKYLVALEENNFDVFDSRVIARGFLLKYSKLLGLNDDRVLAFWRRDFNLDKQNERKGKYWYKNFALTPGFFLAISFVFVLGLFLTVGLFQYFNARKPPKITITSPTNEQVVDSESVLVSGEVGRGVEVYLNNKQLGLDGGEFKEQVYINKGVNKFNITALSPYGIKSDTSLTVYGNFEDNLTNVGENSDTLVVENLSESPAFVEVKIGGSVSFSGYLLGGSSRGFNGEEIEFFTDTSEIISLTYNEEAVDKGENQFGNFSIKF